MHNHQNTFSRRTFLQSTAIASLSLSALSVAPQPGFAMIGKPRKLHIPKLESGRDEAGTTAYDLTMQNGESEFAQRMKTKTSGINGAYLGPTLRLRNGDNIRINVKNELGETSTLHWHGMHLPASQDGGPHQMIKNGKSWSPQFAVKQKAASLWYHPHLMEKTAEHVWRGLAGMIIIEDEESDLLDLPSQYGIDDIPLILHDRTFNEDGSMPYTSNMHFSMMGLTGRTPLSNGTLSAFFEAKTRLLRLRILNGSNASFYNLGLDNGKSFRQIASDGGFLERPVEMKRLLLSPAERAEIIVELAPGEIVNLRNFEIGKSNDASGTMGSMMGGMMQNNGAVPNFNFLEIRAQKTLSQSPQLPEQLTTIKRLQENEASRTRSFDLQMNMGPSVMLGLKNPHLINDKVMKLSRIDETITRDTTEIWEITNSGAMRHPFHIHDVQFQILDRNANPPPENERGFKDTVLVHSGETVRLIMKFSDYADPESPYMYHCHILEHEDAGMMGQFVVV